VAIIFQAIGLTDLMGMPDDIFTHFFRPNLTRNQTRS